MPSPKSQRYSVMPPSGSEDPAASTLTSSWSLVLLKAAVGAWFGAVPVLSAEWAETCAALSALS